MTVYVDADGCPVVDITVELAKKYGVPCVLLCDTAHELEREGVTTVTVPKGANSVDFTLVNLLEKDDMAITQDYGLAAMCMSRSSAVLNQNGLRYTQENIDALLTQRYTAAKLRRAGGRQKRPKKRTTMQNAAFREVLTQLLEDSIEKR